MSPIEIIATALGFLCVVLVVLRSIWNYPFAILSVALFAWVFYGARLYSDALLQIFFIVVNVYGWLVWARASAAEGEVRVLALARRSRVAWLAGMVLATLVWGAAMQRYTAASFPFWDASVAIPSVTAQILQSQRRIESWVLWIAVDIVAIPLYATKGLMLAAALYVVYLALAGWGLVDWHRARRAVGLVVA